MTDTEGRERFNGHLLPTVAEHVAQIARATTHLIIELRGDQRIVLNGEVYIGEIEPDPHGEGWITRRGAARQHYPTLHEAETAALRGSMGW